ncbi:MAG: ATP-binding protein [Desulfobulbaceae bacterium]|nr:ATP-binding protein [Desulfobulbaceae bacterium]
MTLRKSTSGKQTLAKQTLMGMALRIALIVVAATGGSYLHMQNTLHDSILKSLSNSVELRGMAESEQFLLAERQTVMVRDEFLRRLEAMGDYDPQNEFDQIFARGTDGLIRVRPEINDHRHHATAYLRHDVQLTPELRRRFFIGWQLMDQWGPMLVNRFFSGFMNMPEQLSINFCPTADWGRSATRETDINIYETVWRATVEKNPKRKSFWTTVYYDPGAKAWMVSCVTPGDYHGRWVVTGGQDVEISDLVKRTTPSHGEDDTWNFIVDSQGNLIAHPNLTEQIAKAGGNLQANQLGDPRLLAMVKAVLAQKNEATLVLEPPGLDVILGITKIKGPGWHFVTVYPRQLLTAQAWSTARLCLFVGFGTLLLELVILAIILRRQISEPVAKLVSMTEQISHGDFSTRIEMQNNNELGDLASSFNRMAIAIGERDVTLNKQFNELKKTKQIKQDQQRLESIGTLAGGIAHDFNNILSAIIGYADLALMRELDDGRSVREDLCQVRKAADRATDLVRQILTFSRKQPQEKIPLQISLVIKEALKLLRASIPTTIEIRQEIISSATVLADPTQIHQIVMNLCTNAYHAMMEDGGVLGVTLEETTIEPGTGASDLELPPGRYVVFSVSDTGCGMDKETMSKIFDPYFTTKEIGKGTGLGLAVVHGIVKTHNGRVSVYSELGKGTTFNVYLPMIVREAVAEAVVEMVPPVAKSHERIMVVDDEGMVRDVVSRSLIQAGYQVETFSNGLEAWNALSQAPYAWDLLVTDQTMPEITGDQLAVKVLEIRADLPIIICSGYNSIMLDKAYLPGLILYLQKPVSRKALLTQVAKSLAKRNRD